MATHLVLLIREGTDDQTLVNVSRVPKSEEILPVLFPEIVEGVELRGQIGLFGGFMGTLIQIKCDRGIHPYKEPEHHGSVRVRVLVYLPASVM